MAVTPVGSPTTATVSGPNTITANTPTGVQEGDLIIGVTSATTSTQPLGAPSGWELVEETAQWESRTLEMWWGFAPASPPATYSFTMNGLGTHTLALRAYRGTHKTNPIGASSFDQHGDVGSNFDMVIPSITPPYRNALLLAVVGGELVTWTSPGSMTERWDFQISDGGSSMSQAGAEQSLTTDAATGTRTFTASVSTGAGGIMVAIMPPNAWHVGYVGSR